MFEDDIAGGRWCSRMGITYRRRGTFAQRAQRVRDHWICAAFPFAQPLWIPAKAGIQRGWAKVPTGPGLDMEVVGGRLVG